MTYTFARQDWKKDGYLDLVRMCKVEKELGIEKVKKAIDIAKLVPQPQMGKEVWENFVMYIHNPNK